MDQIILFALLGLGTGALIAGIGLGVVLTYRGSGVINVATGAMAMAAGYAFYSLKTVVDTPLALLGTLAFTIVLGTAVELLCFRPLRTASPLARLVSSLGVLLTLQAGATLIYGTGSLPAPSVLPRDTVRGHRRRDPGGPLLADGDRDRHHHPADGRLSLHALRPGHAGRQRERGVGHPGRPARGRAVAREHGAERGHRGRHGRARRVAGPARRHDAAAAGRAGARARCSSRASRRSRSRARSGLSIGVAAVAALLRLDAELVPDRQGRGPARDQRAADLHHHRHRALRARLEPADARRAHRAAPAGRAAARAPRLVRGPVRGGRRRRARRAALRLPQRADHLAGGDDHLPVLRRHHRLHRPGVAHAGRAGRRLGLRRVAPLQGRRHRLPAGRHRRVARRDGAGLRGRRLGAARARRQPGRRDAGGGRGDRAVRLRQRNVGRRRDRLAGARARSSSASTWGRGPRSAGSTATCRARSSASACWSSWWPSACSSPRCGAPGWAGGCSPCAPTSARPRPPASTCATRSSPPTRSRRSSPGSAGRSTPTRWAR